MCNCKSNCKCNSFTVPTSTGTAGAPGNKWYTGAGAPSSGTGIQGDMYLNTTNNDVYQKGASSWTLVSNIEGAEGPAGPTVSGGLIVVGVNASSTSLPAELVLTVPYTKVQEAGGDTFEIEVFADILGNTELVIDDITNSTELLRITLPIADLQYRLGFKFLLTRELNRLKGIYEVKGWAVNNETAYYDYGAWQIVSPDFTEDVEYQFSFDPAASPNIFRYGVVKFFSSDLNI